MNSSSSLLSGVVVERDERLAQVEITVLAIILLVAVVGNSFVLVALWRQMKFRPMSRMYLFMMHLSCADLLVALFSILPQMIWKITFRFQGGDVLCRTIKYLQVMVLYLSTYILVMMAIDRYRAICWTCNLFWNSLKLAKILVGAAWVIAIVFAIPQAIIFKMVDLNGVRECWVEFLQPWGAKAYVTWFVASAFLVPLAILTFCYGVICYKIWNYNPSRTNLRGSCAADSLAMETASSAAPGTGTGNGTGTVSTVDKVVKQRQTVLLRRNGRNQITHAKMKTAKLTLIVVLCFVVCWSPFCITQLVMAYSPPKQAGAAETIFVLLACLNSCTNPWIYLAFSGSLINHLRVCLGLGLRRARDNDSIGDEEPEPNKDTCRPLVQQCNRACKLTPAQEDHALPN